MNNKLYELIESQYNEIKEKIERKQEILTAAIKNYKEWVQTATEYEIVNFDTRLENIEKKRFELDVRKEELHRLQWLYEEAKKEIENA